VFEIFFVYSCINFRAIYKHLLVVENKLSATLPRMSVPIVRLDIEAKHVLFYEISAMTKKSLV